MKTLAPSLLIGSSLFLQVTSYGPGLTAEFSSCSISWKRIDQLRPNCVYILSLTRSTLLLKSLFFGKFATELRPLIDVIIWFLLHILRTNRQIETKFCIHIIIDKIYIGNVNLCFSQIYNRVMALDWHVPLVFAPYYKNEWTEFNQILYIHYHWQDLCRDCYAPSVLQ